MAKSKQTTRKGPTGTNKKLTAKKTSTSALSKRMTTKFDLNKLSPAIKKSPLRLKDWLDLHIPGLVGPRIDSIDPPGGQRGTILTIRGARFETNRLNNHVTIGGTDTPVLAASSDELKVLVTKDVDSGPVKVQIGTHSAAGPHDFDIKGYPGGSDDGPPVFAMGAGDGAAGDVNPIGTVRVLVVICQATDKVPGNLTTIRNTVNDRWTNVQTFYSQASFTRTNVQFDVVNTAAALDGNFTDFVDSAGAENVISGQKNADDGTSPPSMRKTKGSLSTIIKCCARLSSPMAASSVRGAASDTQTFFYDDGKPAGDPDHIHVDITLSHTINLLWINESANWGRFAHEFAHNMVSAPGASGDGSATLGEDVYGSDLVDPDAATAQQFEMMGKHDNTRSSPVTT